MSSEKMKEEANRAIRAKILSMPNSEPMKHSDLTAKIIECAYKVHNKLGFGFLEAVYQKSLMVELLKAGLDVKSEAPIKIYYEGVLVGDYIADIVVEDKVILELKSVKDLHPAHEA